MQIQDFRKVLWAKEKSVFKVWIDLNKRHHNGSTLIQYNLIYSSLLSKVTFFFLDKAFIYRSWKKITIDENMGIFALKTIFQYYHNQPTANQNLLQFTEKKIELIN